MGKKKKVIAVVSSDWHLHNFKAYTENLSRLRWSIKAGEFIADVCNKHNAPLLFTGDMFHTPKQVENEVTTQSKLFYKRAFVDKGLTTLAIPGNHDQSQKNTRKNKSPHYLEEFMIFPRFHNVSDTEQYIGKRTLVTGVEYYSYERDLIDKIRKKENDLKKRKLDRPDIKRVLLLHSNAPGAKTTTGQTIEDCKIPADLDKFFEFWDLVLFGHIHLPQKLSKKCYMIGSPIQQTWGDEGKKMGYWLLYEDLSMDFMPMNAEFPEFKSFSSKEEADRHRVDSYKGRIDYINVVEPEKEDDQEESFNSNFKPNTNRNELAKAYCDKVGITNTKKINALKKVLSEV